MPFTEAHKASARSLLTLALLPLATNSCQKAEVAVPPSTTSEVKPRSQDEGQEQPEVPQPEIDARPSSLHETLLAEGHIALFSDEAGVYAIGVSGDTRRIFETSFEWMTLDYGSGILWLDRSWAEQDPGLYVANLAASDPELIKVTRLKRGVEILDAHADVLPMTEGEGPYQISVNSGSWAITATNNECTEECVASESATDLAARVEHQYWLWTSPVPTLRRLGYPNGEGIRGDTTFIVPPEDLGLELRAVGPAGHSGRNHMWQLYDRKSEEFVSPLYGTRSKQKLDEGYQVFHVMSCERGGLIVSNGFFDAELNQLDHGRNTAKGVCLAGGVLFEDRSSLRARYQAKLASVIADVHAIEREPSQFPARIQGRTQASNASSHEPQPEPALPGQWSPTPTPPIPK